MKPLKHFIIGLFISFLLYFFDIIDLFPSLLILTSNSLIDSDHYFYYVYYKKNFSLRKAYLWFIRKSKQSVEAILIFHGIEFITALIILAIIFPIVWWIFLGVVIHFLCEMIGEERRKLLFKNIVITRH